MRLLMRNRSVELPGPGTAAGGGAAAGALGSGTKPPSPEGEPRIGRVAENVRCEPECDTLTAEKTPIVEIPEQCAFLNSGSVRTMTCLTAA